MPRPAPARRVPYDAMTPSACTYLPPACLSTLPLHTASLAALTARPRLTPPPPCRARPTPHAPATTEMRNTTWSVFSRPPMNSSLTTSDPVRCATHYPRTTQPAIHQARHHRLAPSSPCTEDDPKKWHRARMPILDDDVTKSPRSRHTPSALARTTHAQRTHNAMHARTHTQSRDVDVRTRLPPGPCAHCIADDDYPKATKLRPCRNKSYSLRISEACPAPAHAQAPGPGPAPCPALPRPCPAPPLLVLFCP